MILKNVYYDNVLYIHINTETTNIINSSEDQRFTISYIDEMNLQICYTCTYTYLFSH